MVKYLIVVIILVNAFSGFSQSIEKQVYGSSGGELIGNSSSVEFVVGETLVFERTSKSGTLSEGFLYGYKIYAQPLSNNVQELESIQMDVYPNPTTDVLNLKTSGIDNYNYTVLNGLGEAVLSGTSTSELNEINFSSVSSGTYYLVVSNSDSIIKKFKIIKIK